MPTCGDTIVLRHGTASLRSGGGRRRHQDRSSWRRSAASGGIPAGLRRRPGGG